MPKTRVLVVDDDPMLRELVSHFLVEGGGYDVADAASNGAEAVAQAHTRRPDAIVLDHHMPGESGLEALPELRATAPAATIVLWSADPEVKAAALAAGADHFALKTLGLQALADQLTAIPEQQTRSD